jgi:flagellin-like hook-associated protein FlgL
MGGRDQEMTFGIGTIDYSSLYSDARKIAGGPNDGKLFNLSVLPSDAVATKEYGRAADTGILKADTLLANKTYIITSRDQAGNDEISADEDKYQTDGDSAFKIRADATAVYRGENSDGTGIVTGAIEVGDVLVMKTTAVADDIDDGLSFKEVNADDTFKAGLKYEIVSLGNSDGDVTYANFDDAGAIGRASADVDDSTTLVVGQQFTVDADASVAELAHLNALTEGMKFRRVGATDEMTSKIEDIQALINTARVQAGSQYAAMESAVNYTTDLTAQYELGYNTVNDVNFSMETAHLAKNQILQQAATAMLAQANSGQQGLLQLIS